MRVFFVSQISTNVKFLDQVEKLGRLNKLDSYNKEF